VLVDRKIDPPLKLGISNPLWIRLLDEVGFDSSTPHEDGNQNAWSIIVTYFTLI